MNKYEQLIEHIINDDDAKARALFHDIVVEKSRDIYESLMDEEYAEEDIHSGNQVDRMMDEIQGDETMEGDDEMGMGGDDMDDMGGDDMGDMDMGDDDMDKMPEDAFMREYVEKVGNPKHGDNGANTKSTVAGKNDMGGTTANIVKGGESTTGGTKGGLANPSSKEDNAGNVNVPGGKAGVKHLKKMSTPAGGDNGVNTKSTIGAK